VPSLSSAIAVAAGVTATLRNIHVSGGQTTVSTAGLLTILQSQISDGYFENIDNAGTLRIELSLVSGQFLDWNPEILNEGDLLLLGSTITGTAGGGVLNGQTATIVGTIFVNNTAYSYAGALENYGTATIRNCEFLNNYSATMDGAITNRGTLTIRNSMLSGNTSEAGSGGIGNEGSGVVTIQGVTLTGNDGYVGGAVFNAGGTVSVTASIISRNFAHFEGGGILNAGELDASNSSIIDNSAQSDGGGIYTCLAGQELVLPGFAPPVQCEGVPPVLTNVTMSGNIPDDEAP
jgi:hypothetical protein